MYSRFLKNNYDVINALLNSLMIGVFITDGKGRTLLVNDVSCRTGGLTREEVIGKSVTELQSSGFIEQSVTQMTLESGKSESILQNLGDGNKVVASSQPIYHNGKIDLIVTTERDITETMEVKELLEREKADRERVRQVVEYFRQREFELQGQPIAENEQTKKLVDKARRVAPLDTTVLLTGPSGTGKEVFANFIYQNSARAEKPYIKVNCGAIPENLIESELFGYAPGAFTGASKSGKQGMFELANGGTLLLDEVAELPLHLQPKLLRAIQEKEIMPVGGAKVIPIDIRIIAATNRNLMEMVREGTFREDLFYRLNILPIELEPLKNREKDIQALTQHFLSYYNRKYKLSKVISDGAMRLLWEYDWPGNIRELENIIERLMISFDGDIITKFQVERAIGHLMDRRVIPVDLAKTSLQQLMDAYEKSILETALNENPTAFAAAEQLQMNKSTLSRRMKKYGLTTASPKE